MFKLTFFKTKPIWQIVFLLIFSTGLFVRKKFHTSKSCLFYVTIIDDSKLLQHTGLYSHFHMSTSVRNWCCCTHLQTCLRTYIMQKYFSIVNKQVYSEVISSLTGKPVYSWVICHRGSKKRGMTVPLRWAWARVDSSRDCKSSAQFFWLRSNVSAEKIQAEFWRSSKRLERSRCSRKEPLVEENSECPWNTGSVSDLTNWRQSYFRVF